MRAPLRFIQPRAEYNSLPLASIASYRRYSIIPIRSCRWYAGIRRRPLKPSLHTIASHAASPGISIIEEALRILERLGSPASLAPSPRSAEFARA